jgi:hypothetical protein
VFNTWGPQTRGIDPGSIGSTALQDSMLQNVVKSEDSGIEERLANAEAHLKIKGPVPKEIYCRLKQIENRILQLESLSPEYFNLQVIATFKLKAIYFKSVLTLFCLILLTLKEKSFRGYFFPFFGTIVFEIR